MNVQETLLNQQTVDLFQFEIIFEIILISML